MAEDLKLTRAVATSLQMMVGKPPDECILPLQEMLMDLNAFAEASRDAEAEELGFEISCLIDDILVARPDLVPLHHEGMKRFDPPKNEDG